MTSEAAASVPGSCAAQTEASPFTDVPRPTPTLRPVPAFLASGGRGLSRPRSATDPGRRSLSEEEEDGHGGGWSLEVTQSGLGLTEDNVCWLPFMKDELLEP